MTSRELVSAIAGHELYNLHSHTHYCDGRAPLSEMVRAAADGGFAVWGVSPHSPIPVYCSANMHEEDVRPYLEEMGNLTEEYRDRLTLLTSMEIDYLGPDWGPHIDYFQKMPLDYRIGSVHFVPSQEGIPMDCDGSAERFAEYLRSDFKGDLRYVVEKYFEQVLRMIERGGFELLGHFDKIAGNASSIDPEIEQNSWYEALVDDVISHARNAGLLVEINTKAIHDRKRFYPNHIWWPKLKSAGIPLAVNSDAHYPDKINLGRPEALKILKTN